MSSHWVPDPPRVLGPQRILGPPRVLGPHRVLGPSRILRPHRVLGPLRILGPAFPVCLEITKETKMLDFKKRHMKEEKDIVLIENNKRLLK